MESNGLSHVNVESCERISNQNVAGVLQKKGFSLPKPALGLALRLGGVLDRLASQVTGKSCPVLAKPPLILQLRTIPITFVSTNFQYPEVSVFCMFSAKP